MQKQRQNPLSQNFLYNSNLVQNLLDISSIAHTDLVLEIGPGKGIITSELLKRVSRLFAVEIDPELIKQLNKKFSINDNFLLFEADVLNFPLPVANYKVFSNIPFSIEGQIIRKLIDSINPPIDSYLIVQQELAERLSGLNGFNQFYTSHFPWFDFEIPYRFKRSDFKPVSAVDPVLFRFSRKINSVISFEERNNYINFIEKGFKNGLSVYKNLSINYNFERVNLAFNYLSINRRTKPSYIKPEQWVELYKRIN